MNMRLFLASEAKNPKTIKKLEEYLHGFKGKTMAYIPTASNGEKFRDWRKTSESWKLVRKLGFKATPVQLEDYGNPSVVKELENKNIIWFAGGYCGYLMYWIRRCGLDKALPKLLEKSLYVGSSAGSMITGTTLELAENSSWDNEPGASTIPTLNLVDFDISPHFEEWQLPEIKKIYHGKKLYLLKNGEEIIVEDKKVTVVGEERILTTSHFQNAPGKKRSRQGLR